MDGCLGIAVFPGLFTEFKARRKPPLISAILDTGRFPNLCGHD